MKNTMKELNFNEIEEVSGGIAPAIWGLFLGASALGFSFGQAYWGR